VKGRAYIVLGPALVGAEVAYFFKVPPALAAKSKVSLVHAAIEDASGACGGSIAGMRIGDVSLLL
jgi:hypothetical protein